MRVVRGFQVLRVAYVGLLGPVAAAAAAPRSACAAAAVVSFSGRGAIRWRWSICCRGSWVVLVARWWWWPWGWVGVRLFKGHLFELVAEGCGEGCLDEKMLAWIYRWCYLAVAALSSYSDSQCEL